MKTVKNISRFAVAVLMLTIFMSTTCNKNNDDPSSDCNGYITATATGALAQSFCMDVKVSYTYIPGESLSFVARQDGDPIYSCSFQVWAGDQGFSGPGTYACGMDNQGYVELDVHGTDNEYYKAQSGTLTITEVSETTLKGTFSVTAVGYYNQQTITFSGSVNN